jgi:anti-sigma factor ChrR (cupin superfamily)
MPPDEDALRAAARELIAAGRSLLDAAEAVLDDPNATERVVAVMSTIAQQAQRMTSDAVNEVSNRLRDSDAGS